MMVEKGNSRPGRWPSESTSVLGGSLTAVTVEAVAAVAQSVAAVAVEGSPETVAVAETVAAQEAASFQFAGLGVRGLLGGGVRLLLGVARGQNGDQQQHLNNDCVSLSSSRSRPDAGGTSASYQCEARHGDWFGGC